jgi:signal transduction histidine kinase
MTATANLPADHSHEGERLAALHALRILDTPSEERFDRITRIAARLFGAQYAFITFVDADRLWSKSCFGMDASEGPRQDSFCIHDLHRADALVVPDATLDPHFAFHPNVIGEPGIRFYAGAIIRSADGLALGRLCVLDTVAHHPSEKPLAELADLATWVELELHRGAALAPTADPAAVAVMQERFVTVAAHELRTPLTLIRGYSEELLDPMAGELTDDQHDAAAAIASGALRLQALVNNLLLLLELDAGRVPVESEQVDVEFLAAGVRAELAPAAERTGVVVELDIPPDATVPADPRRLSAALGALLRNAIAWSPPAGRVRIAAAMDDKELRLFVTDEGPGLPPVEAAAIGRRFGRLRGNDPREGAGLGLAIARGIAELHGGRLEADPQPGDGARVSIVLPATGQSVAGGRYR